MSFPPFIHSPDVLSWSRGNSSSMSACTHAHTKRIHHDINFASLNFNHKNALRIVVTVAGFREVASDEGGLRLLLDGYREGEKYRVQKGSRRSSGNDWKDWEEWRRVKAKKETPTDRQGRPRRRWEKTAAASNGEAVYARVNCSIVKCANAGLKNSAIVSLALSVRSRFSPSVSRILRNTPSENICRLFSRPPCTDIVRGLPFLPVRYTFHQARHRATVLYRPSRY